MSLPSLSLSHSDLSYPFVSLSQSESDDLTRGVMFEDDDMGLQTMPWFDPNYQGDHNSRQSEVCSANLYN